MELKRHIIFRDFLQNNPEELNKLRKIKNKLYKKFPNDRDAYIEGKDLAVKRILREALKEQDNV